MSAATKEQNGQTVTSASTDENARPQSSNVAAPSGATSCSKDIPNKESKTSGGAAGVGKSKGGGKKRKPGRRWTKAEDAVLKELVEKHGNRHWKRIAEAFAEKSGTQRSDVQCLHRWNKCLKPGLIKGPWRIEEDQIIRGMIDRYGINNVRWSVIAKMLPGRLGKQVRERWINHLDPTIIKTEWTAEEDANLANLHRMHGNRWKLIAQKIPGRSENGVKNRWHSLKQTQGKDGKPKAAPAKRKAVKPMKSAKAAAAPESSKSVGSSAPSEKKSSVLGKRLTTTVAPHSDNGRLDNKLREMVKVAHHAQSLLQMSENYKLMANLMLQSTGTPNITSNGVADAALAPGSLLPTGASKRMKLASSELSTKTHNESFRNLLALQELSKGPQVNSFPSGSLNSTSGLTNAYGGYQGLLSMNSLSAPPLPPMDCSPTQNATSNKTGLVGSSAALAQSFPHCFSLFSKISASSGRAAAKNQHDSEISVFI